eukprot:gnl/TRDRNA2_/TRDRNA2_54059_c0_seq1.p1 gnl/TRDRNA2_/TRDRNA2_54059_c0~~gnl/TRDRNA2_/TRDRNA2_54059_c0_seq1.p1  ORF type:complete len:221 (+),score=37.47 gnl/TRDRNA2_/TRDRNA2_54059_c0_seq1:82-744(+)
MGTCPARLREPQPVAQSQPIWSWVHALRHEQRSGLLPEVKALPVDILPHLLLGDKSSARDIGRLKADGITHVLNVAGLEGMNKDIDYAGCGMSYLSLDGEDEHGYPMLARHLASARAFVEQAKAAGGRCLVHCVAGINRSGVIVAAELMLSERLPVLEAVARCRQARGRSFLWNKSFQEELIGLAQHHDLLGERPEGFSDEPPPSVLPPPAARDAFKRLL